MFPLSHAVELISGETEDVTRFESWDLEILGCERSFVCVTVVSVASVISEIDFVGVGIGIGIGIDDAAVGGEGGGTCGGTCGICGGDTCGICGGDTCGICGICGICGGGGDTCGICGGDTCGICGICGGGMEIPFLGIGLVLADKEDFGEGVSGGGNCGGVDDGCGCVLMAIGGLGGGVEGGLSGLGFSWLFVKIVSI